MRNASGHNYLNSSFIVDLAMGQIPFPQNVFLDADKLLYVLYNDGCFSPENSTCNQKELLLRCLPAFATDVDWKTFSIWTSNETLDHVCSL